LASLSPAARRRALNPLSCTRLFRSGARVRQLSLVLLLFALPAFMGDVLQVFLCDEWGLGRGDVVQVTRPTLRAASFMAHNQKEEAQVSVKNAQIQACLDIVTALRLAFLESRARSTNAFWFLIARRCFRCWPFSGCWPTLLRRAAASGSSAACARSLRSPL
jgi:hypothetical protein